MNFDFDNYKHNLDITVRYNDLDTLGHVNNAAYLSYLEEARIDYYREVAGLEKYSLDFRSVVARVDISYRRAVFYGDEVKAFTRCSKIGSRSMDFETVIAVIVNGEPVVAAKATVTLVSVDTEKGVSVPNNPERVRLIREFEGNL